MFGKLRNLISSVVPSSRLFPRTIHEKAKKITSCPGCKIPVKCCEDGKCFRVLEQEFLARQEARDSTENAKKEK